MNEQTNEWTNEQIIATIIETIYLQFQRCELWSKYLGYEKAHIPNGSTCQGIFCKIFYLGK